MNVTPAPAVRIVEVDAESDGQRIDNFIAKFLKGVPKSRIYRCLRKGEVRVNGGRVKPSSKLVALKRQQRHLVCSISYIIQ